jgi:hypothetical protein
MCQQFEGLDNMITSIAFLAASYVATPGREGSTADIGVAAQCLIATHCEAKL